MDRERLPEERVVVRFSLSDAPKHNFWLLVQRPAPEVCIKPPGFEEDLIVKSDTDSVARWYMGRFSLGQAMRARRITIQGPRHLVREFSSWGGQSPFAAVPPARTAVA